MITGGARGIGAATAKRLAAGGAAVAVLDLDEIGCHATVDEMRRAGQLATAVIADVSDSDVVDDAVARVANELGPPTILVNNAGIVRDNLLFRMTDPDWDQVIAVHLRG